LFLPTTFSLAFVLAMIAPHLFADSVTLNAAADTGLVKNSPNNNMGGQLFVNAGSNGSTNQNRGLFLFDLAKEIPAGSRITSATLLLQVVGEPSEPPVPSTFRIYRVLRPWGEGDKGSPGGPGQGTAATIGEATWNDRMALTTNSWAVPGGLAGIDFLAQSSSSQYIYGIVNPLYTFVSTSNTVADAQLWLDSTNSNFGWILISDSENVAYTARRFGSREAGVDAPQLAIDFVPPPRLQNAQINSNRIEFTVAVEPGQSFAVQSVNALPSTNWNVVTNIPAPTSTTNVLVSDPLSGSQKFYRLKSP